MEIELADLWSSWPSCSLCCFYMFSENSPPLQLGCCHLFCSSCLVSLWDGAVYTCPWDSRADSDVYLDNEVRNRMEEVCAIGEKLTKHTAASYYYWFARKISRQQVPCRNHFVTHSCSARHCCSSHDARTWQQTPCPLWDSCTRAQWCPYRHSWTPAPISAAVQLFDTIHPVQLAHVTEAREDQATVDLLSMTSTLHMKTYLRQGQIIVRSKSLVQLLLANDSQLLTDMAVRHRVQIKVNLSKVKYMSNVQWVYYDPPDLHNFKEYYSMQLEAAFKREVPTFALSEDTSIYFPLMLSIAPDRFYQIDRYEKVTGSTDAAMLVVESEGSGVETMATEVRGYEDSVELGDKLYCRQLLPILRQHGLSVLQGKAYGTKSDLSQACREMEAVLEQQRQLVCCYPLPVGVEAATVTETAKQLGLQAVVFDVRVFGTEAALATLMQQLYLFFDSIPTPINVSPERIDSICRKYDIVQMDRYLSGRKERVALALAELAESSVPIPASATEDQVIEIIRKFDVRREGDQLLGPQDAVKAAYHALEQAEHSVAYPKHIPLPQLQSIAQKHQLRLVNDRMYGAPAALIKALDALNSLGASGEFQFHSPPRWYREASEEVKLVTLAPGTEEFEAVAARFMATAARRVTRIQEVHNRRLYTSFAFKHEAYSRIEGRALEIKRLFHGTRQNRPRKIYESDEGLDSRLGKGSWGVGTYFAEQAQYSTAYAHQSKKGVLKMFLCEVIVGDYVHLSPNGNLRKPPLKPNSKQAYHSVQGYGGGSGIWITYEPAMSYPRFLISYD